MLGVVNFGVRGVVWFAVGLVGFVLVLVFPELRVLLWGWYNITFGVRVVYVWRWF